MVSKQTDRGALGFTLVELLVVVAIIGILVALLVPVFGKVKERSKTLACISQLKQIGVASTAFAGDHNEQLPATIMPNTNRFLSPLQPIYTELKTPKVFLCPADEERIAETSLTSLNRTNSSYFVSYSARTDQPTAILAGDRNVTLVDFSNPGAPSGVPGRFAGGGWTLKRTNVFGWWRDMHHSKGNMLLVDGSVHTTNPRELNAQVRIQPEPTFDWYVPNNDVVFTPYP